MIEPGSIENKRRICVLKGIYYKVVYKNRTFTINKCFKRAKKGV